MATMVLAVATANQEQWPAWYQNSTELTRYSGLCPDEKSQKLRREEEARRGRGWRLGLLHVGPKFTAATLKMIMSRTLKNRQQYYVVPDPDDEKSQKLRMIEIAPVVLQAQPDLLWEPQLKKKCCLVSLEKKQMDRKRTTMATLVLAAATAFGSQAVWPPPFVKKKCCLVSFARKEKDRKRLEHWPPRRTQVQCSPVHYVGDVVPRRRRSPRRSFNSGKH
jgi:hypothetical protein